MTEISTNCAPLFHLLVHAALFPRLGLQVPEFVSSFEEDESRDSLAHGGVIWDYLLYVWAFETGAGKLEEIVGGRGATIEARGFYAALGEVQGFVELEFSVPLHAMGQEGPLTWAESPFEEMPPFEGQRLHLCRRSIWFPIDFTGASNNLDGDDGGEMEASTGSGEVPLFAEPVLASESSGRLGQVWVRVSEYSQQQLKLALPSTLESLAIIGHGRAAMLQDSLHREQPALDADQLRDLNGYVQMLRERAITHRDAATRLSDIKDHTEQQEVSATFLDLINSECDGADPEGASATSLFISYSQDSDEHRSWVLDLSKELADHGFDVRVDAAQDSPEEGWPRWMRRQIDSTDYVLCVCTPTYRDRFDSKQELGTGRGADYEGLLIAQLLYECNSRNERIIPVLPEAGNDSHVPLSLRPFTHYKLPGDLRRLLDRITTLPGDRASGEP